ncbi:hypothetical protein M8J76_004075 [Diaphorina citri]|nr:hypothetical protein M8J75_001269 [Diaphorina citri]KAI5736512.1 hypothetical protein M8J76_004075 [Diaphorina citri]
MSRSEYLIVDTSAFIKNAQLQDIGDNVITIPEVVNEVTSKRQIRRLVVLPYDLQIKEADPDSISFVTEFSKKTGDYPSLSSTDIKGIKNENTDNNETHNTNDEAIEESEGTGKTFEDCVSSSDELEREEASEEYYSANEDNEKTEHQESHENAELEDHTPEVLQKIDHDEEEHSDDSGNEDDDDGGEWITPSNLKQAQRTMDARQYEEKPLVVSCVTTDFAMQNVLKQMGLNVVALDGRLIRELRTFILRCYACYKTTSIMTKVFCPKCGYKTLKRVAVSVDEQGKQKIHINLKRPLTARGKKFSLPTFKGGKHANNPIVAEDQPVPDQRPTRLGRTKTNALDPDYIAGMSPFAVHDINSKSAMLGIRNNGKNNEVKYWMYKNPNAVKRKAKK